MPPGVGGGGAGSDGAIGVGAGFGTRFLAFALLAGFAFFIAFFLRDAPPRFAFLDFFATFNLPNRTEIGQVVMDLPAITGHRSSNVPQVRRVDVAHSNCVGWTGLGAAHL